ncbi:MAG: tetratricopeptide repeat protein, partial [Acidobacteriota bacterium]
LWMVRTGILFAFLVQLLGADPVADRLLEAQQLMAQGNLEGAERLLIRTAAEFPPDPRLSNFLGVVSVQLGKADEAERNFRQAVELAPAFAGALLNLGRFYQEALTENPAYLDRALETYNQLLKVEPQNMEANYQKAFLLQMKGEHSESNRYLTRLPAEHLMSPQALALICANSAALGETDRMTAACSALVQHSELIEEDVLPTLSTLVQAKQTTVGIELMEKLASQGRLSQSGLEQLSTLYLEKGDFPRSKLILDQLAPGHPNLPALLVRLAWVDFKAGEFEGALGYLAHARDLTPENDRLHAFFGVTCIELGLGAEAMKSFELALSLNPENPFYNYLMATSVLHWREATEAIPYFEKFIALSPDDPKGAAGLGRAHFLNKEYEKARLDFESVVDQPETAAEANFYLGAIDRMEQKLEDSEEHLTQALTLAPDNVDAMAELAWIYTRNRDFEKARQLLDRALELDPEHYQANFNLLTFYSRTRDERYEEQKEYFEKVKEKKWQAYSDSLRSIQAVPHYVFPDFQLEFNRNQ